MSTGVTSAIRPEEARTEEEFLALRRQEAMRALSSARGGVFKALVRVMKPRVWFERHPLFTVSSVCVAGALSVWGMQRMMRRTPAPPCGAVPCASRKKAGCARTARAVVMALLKFFFWPG